jgi:hypothetical protein
MEHKTISQVHLEEMGLRLESAGTLRPLDAVVRLALLVSGLVWTWVAINGANPTVSQVISSSIGRVGAAALGVATFLALIRSVKGSADR